MKKEEEIFYVYLQEGDKKQTKPMRKLVAGISSLYLIVKKDKFGKRNGWEYWVRKKLGRYQTSRCTLGMEQEMAKRLEYRGAFEARKEELLTDKTMILKELIKQEKKLLQEKADAGWGRRRKSVLLVLDFEVITSRELMELLLCVKDFIEEIFVMCQAGDEELEKARLFLYEEWGIVVHKMEMKQMDKTYDLAFFCVKQWERQFRGIIFRVGYLLEQYKTEAPIQSGGILYSGFCYERNGMEVPYHMAVDMRYQNPEKYVEFGITSVAICPVEC